MKKLAIIGSLIISSLIPLTVFAQDAIKVSPPPQGFPNLGQAINNIIIVAFAVAILLVLVMLVLGAFEWITSGGDKEAVGKARNRIINALIGLAVLAIAFALANVAARFTGVSLFNLVVPSPTAVPTGSGGSL